MMTAVFERMDFAEKLVLYRDQAAFAEHHRNLCMSERKIKAHGITFFPTAEGIYKALCEVYGFREIK